MPVLDAFKMDVMDLYEESMNYATAGEATVDIARFTFSVFVFTMIIPFVHSNISKVFADTVESDAYSKGPADANL